MKRHLSALIVGMFLAVSAWSQDAESESSDTTETVTIEETQDESEQAAEFDDADLDDQTYSDEDDDFRPSEKIPADQSIAFPTDI